MVPVILGVPPSGVNIMNNGTQYQVGAGIEYRDRLRRFADENNHRESKCRGIIRQRDRSRPASRYRQSSFKIVVVLRIIQRLPTPVPFGYEFRAGTPFSLFPPPPPAARPPSVTDLYLSLSPRAGFSFPFVPPFSAVRKTRACVYT